MKTIKNALITSLALFAAPLLLTAQTTKPKAAKPAVKKAAAPAPAPAPAAPAKTAPAPSQAAPKPQQAGTPVRTPYEEAVQKLKSKEPSVRRQGADFLGQSRDQKAAPLLLAALSDEAGAVRSSAVDGLCQMVYRPAVPRITELLTQDKDPLVRQQAASSLSYMMDQAAGPALVKALKDDVPSVRYAAANTLGALRYAPAEDRLIDLLSDQAMRRVAISALGQLQSKKAAPEIFKYLGDQDKYTRLEAVRALGSILDKAAAKELARRLEKTEDPAVRVEAALALAKMGLPEGLITAYEFVKSPDMSLKNQALEVIGAVGDKRSLQFIEELYAAEQNPVNKSMLDFTRQRLSSRLRSQAKP
ncbi:MAG: HEAT repeat domain-containing protein [Elusimicrobiales bacterium]|nr:HEAT repeat domain-containing protein [Elusimicrobiales bacterium]